jgi:hypothetical protein
MDWSRRQSFKPTVTRRAAIPYTLLTFAFFLHGNIGIQAPNGFAAIRIKLMKQKIFLFLFERSKKKMRSAEFSYNDRLNYFFRLL